MPLTGAERAKRFREKLKQDPEKYDAYKKKQVERVKKFQKNIDDLNIEEKEKKRQHWRNQKAAQKTNRKCIEKHDAQKVRPNNKPLQHDAQKARPYNKPLQHDAQKVRPYNKQEGSSLPDVHEVRIVEVGSCEVCLQHIEKKNEFLFVCVQCTNVCVCKACFDEGQHSHHYMLRIPKDKPPDEVSRVVSRLRTELMTETASQEQAVPQVKQEVDDMSEQEQAVPEQEHAAQPSKPCPVDELEVLVKMEEDLNPDPLTLHEDIDYDIIIKEESLEHEIDRRRVKQRVGQVPGSTHTTTATHSHTKRAPSGNSEAGPSKVARFTGIGPHYTRTSTGGRHVTTDTREKPRRSNVQVMHLVYNEENESSSKTYSQQATESLEDEMDRRRVEQRVEQVVDSTHTTTATHSHTKRAPSGDSEAGPSKVARSTGTGPHYTSTGGRHHTTDTREKPKRSNVQVMHLVYNEENESSSKTYPQQATGKNRNS